MNKAQIKKERIIQAVTQHLIAHGLADVGLRTLAAVAGTSDRMLIYYFETKDALLGQALEAIAADLAGQLDLVLGEHRRHEGQLLAELLALGNSPQFEAILRLWFEIVGVAVRGQEPYAATAIVIANNWIEWIEGRLETPQGGRARAVFAELEGNLMLKLIGVAIS